MTLYERAIEIIQSYVGVHEEGGDNRGPQIEEFQKAIDGKAQGESWCMCLQGYVLQKTAAEFDTILPIKLSEHCLTTWGINHNHRRDYPEPGFLVIWSHGAGPSGHTGMVTAVNQDGTISTVEGNTSSSTEVDREGQGVYAKIRSLTPKGSMRIVGFLDPWGEK